MHARIKRALMDSITGSSSSKSPHRAKTRSRATRHAAQPTRCFSNLGSLVFLGGHLVGCAACRVRVNEFRAVGDLLDELPVIEPSGAF